MNYIVKCMTCDQLINITLNNNSMDFHSVATEVARKYDWAMSQNKNGTFLCCGQCYNKTFDLTTGGKVGFLKSEYEHLRRPYG